MKTGLPRRWRRLLTRTLLFAVAALAATNAMAVCSLEYQSPQFNATIGGEVTDVQWALPTSTGAPNCLPGVPVSGSALIISDTTGGASLVAAQQAWNGFGTGSFAASLTTGPLDGDVIVQVTCDTGCSDTGDIAQIDFNFSNAADYALRDPFTGAISIGGSGFTSRDAVIDTPLTLTFETLLSGMPVNTGSISWFSKTSGGTFNGIAGSITTPVSGNQASVQYQNSSSGFDSVGASWDPDGNPGTQNDVFFNIDIAIADMLILTPGADSVQGVFPDIGTPVFSVDLLVNGSPADGSSGYCVDWTVTRPDTSSQIFGCVQFFGGSSVLDFSSFKIPISGPSNYGDWTVEAQVVPNLQSPRRSNANGITGSGAFPGLVFPFGVAMFNLTFEPLGSQPISGQPFSFPLAIRDQNGIGIPGFTVDYSTTGVIATPASGVTAPTQANGATSIDVSNLGPPNASGLFINASVTGFPSINAATNVIVVSPGLAPLSTPPGPNFVFTDATTDTGVYAFASIDSGNGNDPDPGVPVTFTITSGNATFSDFSTSMVASSDSSGIAISDVMLIGRTAGPVTLQAASPNRPTANFSLPVTASNYQLSAVSPQFNSIPGGTSLDLQVLLQSQAQTNPANPLANADIDWIVSGPAGATVSTPTTTQSNGIATSTFTPAAAGPHTITARFNPAPAAASPPSDIVFNVDVVGTFALTAVAPAGGVGGVLPGIPLALQANLSLSGSPLSGESISWAAISSTTPGGVADASLSNMSSITDVNGDASIDFSSVVEGTYVIRASYFPGSNTGPQTKQSAGGAKGSTAPTIADFTITVARPAAVETFEIVSGNNQRGLVGTPAAPLQVRYLLDGQPQRGVLIDWMVSGSATPPGGGSSQTNAEGIATFQVGFGTVPGFATVVASAGAPTVRFDLQAAGPDIAILSGDRQVAAPGSTLVPFVVLVTTPSDPPQPMPDQRISWSVESGDGTLSTLTSVTDANGQASSTLTLGTSGSVSLVEAALDTGDAVRFQANAASAELTRFSGDNQSGPIQTQGDLPLVVTLRDASGTPLNDEVIEWRVSSGNATIFDGENAGGPTAESTTAGNGRAQINFRLGSTPGVSTIEASFSQAGVPVVFTVTAQQPTARIVSGNNQVGTPGQPLTQDLVISIAPEVAKALGGVTVTWQVQAGGGSVAAATTTTGANGQSSNQLTLGTAPGENRVVARITGGIDLVFIANGVVGGNQLIKVSGDNQTGLPTNVDSAPLVVRLSAGPDNSPVVGAQIVWSGNNAQFPVGDGGEVATEVSTLTNAQGEARIVTRVVNAGAASVVARAQGSAADQVMFSLTAGIANLGNLTGPEREVARVIDATCPALSSMSNRSAAQEDLLMRCRELQRGAGDNPDGVEGALEQMTPDVGITLSAAGQEVLTNQVSNVTNYLRQARTNPNGGGQLDLGVLSSGGILPLSFLPSAVIQANAEESAEGQDLGSDFSRWGFFATGIIGQGKYRNGARTPDYEYDSGNLTAGVDYRFNDNVIAGVALGFSRSNTDLRDNSGDLDTSGWNVIGYGTWYNENQWYVDGSLTVGSNDYDLSRLIAYDITALDGSLTRINQVANADTSGDQLALTFSVGRDFQRGAWTFNTYVRGLYMRSEFDSYTERLDVNLPGSGLALAVDAREVTAFNSTIGGRATWIMSREWGILMPHALLEWEHRFEDDPSQLTARFAFDPTGTAFQQTGDDIDSDVFNVGVGMAALWPGGRSAFIQYERLVSAARLSQNTLSIGIRIEF